MKYLLSIILLVIILTMAGCVSENKNVIITPTLTPTPTSEIKISTIEPSEIALQLSDLPAGFTIKERSVKTRSDMDQSSLDMGWKKGYDVIFQRGDVYINQWISVYPIENANQILASSKTESFKLENETIKIIELPDPKIGDSSFALRIREGDYTTYEIDFIKNGVYEGILIWGSTADYETLKDLAKTATAKIK